MLMCLKKHFLHHVQICLQTDKLLYKSYYSMWINHTCRFYRAGDLGGKIYFGQQDLGVHNTKEMKKGVLTHQDFLGFYSPQKHTHTHHNTHNTHTFLSNKARDPKAGHCDSQPNLFLRKGKKTLLLQAALLQNCSLMPQGLCTISSLHTDQRFTFYWTLLFIATTSNISQIDRLTLGHFIWME